MSIDWKEVARTYRHRWTAKLHHWKEAEGELSGLVGITITLGERLKQAEADLAAARAEAATLRAAPPPEPSPALPPHPFAPSSITAWTGDRPAQPTCGYPGCGRFADDPVHGGAG